MNVKKGDRHADRIEQKKAINNLEFELTESEYEAIKME